MKVLVVALAIVVGILGGFYGGYKVGQNNVSAASSSSAGNRGGQFPNGRGAFAAGACPSPGAASPSPGSLALARGTVTNLSSTSMTVSLPGCDVTVKLTTTTSVSKNVAGSTSDLADNQMVIVAGTRQADGSIVAQSVQIGGGRGPGAGTNPTAGG